MSPVRHCTALPCTARLCRVQQMLRLCSNPLGPNMCASPRQYPVLQAFRLSLAWGLRAGSSSGGSIRLASLPVWLGQRGSVVCARMYTAVAPSFPPGALACLQHAGSLMPLVLSWLGWHGLAHCLNIIDGSTG